MGDAVSLTELIQRAGKGDADADERLFAAMYDDLRAACARAFAPAPAESEIVRVHEALDELAVQDQHMATIVEMRYFSGMTEPEIAEAVGIHERTVRRDWEKARLFLREALDPKPARRLSRRRG